jgi:3-methyladenine DNA glycosylase AlkD
MIKHSQPLVHQIRLAVAQCAQTIPALREVRKRYSEVIRSFDGRDVIDLARRLLEHADDDVVRFIAYELVFSHRDAAAALRENDVVALGQGIDSWNAVDTFASYLGGPAWKRGQISDALIASWARSPDRWWRRAALVSTVALNRKPVAIEHTARTLTVCTALVNDNDDMVVKAMSWALRELSKVNAAAVRAFIAQHEDTLAARVKREVGNKLRTGLKTPKPA